MNLSFFKKIKFFERFVLFPPYISPLKTLPFPFQKINLSHSPLLQTLEQNFCERPRDFLEQDKIINQVFLFIIYHCLKCLTDRLMRSMLISWNIFLKFVQSFVDF